MTERTTRHMATRVSRNVDLIAACVLGLAAIGCFVLQALSFSEYTTARETALFNALQFLLTAGFGWFSTRAVTRLSFEENLKRFAVSAYRRISDIDRMIQRLRTHVKDVINTASAEDKHELRVIAAVVDDTLQVVKSSAADWADVIGDEMIAIENIKRLEQERAEVTSRQQEPDEKTTQEVIQRLDSQIEALISKLPAPLRLGAQADFDARYAKFHAADWLAHQHQREGGLELRVVAGGQYLCDRDLNTLQPGEILWLYRGSSGEVAVRDSSGTTCGRALNATPLSYYEFSDAMEACYGGIELPVEFLAVNQSRTRKGVSLTWYRVRVKTEPRSRKERLAVLRGSPPPAAPDTMPDS